MSRSTAVVMLLVLFGFLRSSKAEEIETLKVELYGGYDYVRYNANPRINGVPPSESFSATGINGHAAYNPCSRFGIVGELRGYSLTRTGLSPCAAGCRHFFTRLEELVAYHSSARMSKLCARRAMGYGSLESAAP